MCKAESTGTERVNLLRAELVYSLLTRLSYIQANIEAGKSSFLAPLRLRTIILACRPFVEI